MDIVETETFVHEGGDLQTISTSDGMTMRELFEWLDMVQDTNRRGDFDRAAFLVTVRKGGSRVWYWRRRLWRRGIRAFIISVMGTFWPNDRPKLMF